MTWQPIERFLAAWAGGGIAYWLALANGIPKWTGIRSGSADAVDLYLLVAVLIWALLGIKPLPAPPQESE